MTSLQLVVIDELNQFDKNKESITPLEFWLGAKAYWDLMAQLDEIKNLTVKKEQK